MVKMLMFGLVPAAEGEYALRLLRSGNTQAERIIMQDTGFDAAIERFHRALRQLQQAAEHYKKTDESAAGILDDELSRLKTEREQLVQELEQEKNQRSVEKEARIALMCELDNAIGELRRVLGE